MRGITTVLFDFDGVITNTEPQYDVFFEKLTHDFQLNVSNFAANIKGKRLAETLDNEYPQFSADLKKQIVAVTKDFELTMNFPLVAGVMEFINYLKASGYKVGLVTSSIEKKMRVALTKLNLNGVFDTEVMAGRITYGKPDPMCYLLAADDLGVKPEECIVFEDSIAGVKAGVAAGMLTVGVSTTIKESELRNLTPYVIPDFSDLKTLKQFFV
ncbi:HAD family phosphatase [Paludibacter sp. 221]|uniref:HAD family hydrolase n=1 Tax=Paludibacter sp. 221 TaxID=2302939 RepID=UPI0013D37DA5|nr:HAD family phosphatase [Paludibacter sp. 221]NDV47829.1 HAD family phosphatase [Paludibacter sp. 221]